MNEVIEREAQSLPAQVAQPGNLIEVIARAASDPAMDVGKMERLWTMHQQMVATQAEKEFNDAMVACQRECGPISADANNPQTRSRYATYAKLDKVLRPIYTRHGIAISYSTSDSPKPEHVRVIAYVSRGAYTRTYPVDMPADGKGAKGGDVMTKTHATGAAMAYGSRYLLKGIFNVAVGESDVDGNDVRAKIMPEGQKEDFKTAIESLTADTWKETWDKIVDATKTDAEARDELRTAMAARRKTFK